MSPETMDLIYRLYVALLFGTGLAVIFRKRGDFERLWKELLRLTPMRRVAAILIANWTANTAFVLTTKIYDPWAWFIATDALAAAAVLYQPAGKPQGVIGAIYMAQIVLHVTYALSNQRFAEHNYWQVLICLAFAQLLILGGWFVGHRGRIAYRRGFGRAGPAHAPFG